jgi:ZIP family zinc transporter
MIDTLTFIVIISTLGPIIGSLIGVLKKPSERFMRNMLAFAAGVMLAISFLELIPEAIGLSSEWGAVIGFLIGCLLMFAMDKIIPHIHPELCSQEQGHKLKKTAVYLIMGIFLHNLPEGMAIAIGDVTDPRISFSIAIAIAIHNIPEGICTSAPYYFCTKNRLKSFLISSSTAIPVLVGFFLGRFLFQNIPLYVVGVIASATAGLMVYISGDELIPCSCNKADGHSNIFALVAGVIFVILTSML